MKDELKKVLDMVELGKITSAQAAELIEAMGMGDVQSSPATTKPAKRMLKVHVISAGGDKVDAKLPVSLLKAGIGIGKSFVVSGAEGTNNEALKQLDWDQMMVAIDQMIEDDELGEIVTVNSAGGDTVKVWLE